jgi:hypothetical protein
MKRCPVVAAISFGRVALFAEAMAMTALASISPAALAVEAVEADPSGQSATLPPIGEHWVWVPNRLLQHNFLFDAEGGQMLGAIPSTGSLSPKLPLVAKSRGEIYSVNPD